MVTSLKSLLRGHASEVFPDLPVSDGKSAPSPLPPLACFIFLESTSHFLIYCSIFYQPINLSIDLSIIIYLFIFVCQTLPQG